MIMTFFITSNEPSKIKALFSDALEMPMPFDMMLVTAVGLVPIERKAIPGDLISSVTDGRLQRELIAMRECNKDFQIVIFHGHDFEYYPDDSLKVPDTPKRYAHKASMGWTRKGINNLKRTLEYVEGVHIEQVENDDKLVELIAELQKYFDQRHHLSLKTRPRLEPDYIVPTRAERVRFFYDGIPGLSVVRAKALADRFKSPLDLYHASITDISSVRGFGNKLSKRTYDFLRE